MGDRLGIPGAVGFSFLFFFFFFCLPSPLERNLGLQFTYITKHSLEKKVCFVDKD